MVAVLTYNCQAIRPIALRGWSRDRNAGRFVADAPFIRVIVEPVGTVVEWGGGMGAAVRRSTADILRSVARRTTHVNAMLQGGARSNRQLSTYTIVCALRG